ncbi:BPTI/Kunitz domain-containing protein [Solirubrum puertoriconensis]|uniref:Proteinase inhibitor I4 serpin n=1 Tax=Solirubrum puertoriconensis TaxID=1751427 RepID=A0A9X0HN48_SOLP1|nr:BPTI/Kunitz domain-containing protein [Solirubrum puertoriconensis]KUG09024.1 proteinase inhibitor I4 serpin [Solirubrum puertoriconensis]
MKSICYAFLLLSAGLAGCAKERSLPKQCTLEPETGPCKALMPRYFYNQKTQRCEQFIWGGCGGLVPFQTLEECLDCGCEEA